MFIINKLEFEKQGKELVHKSTRLIKTFPEREYAEAYLEGCLALSSMSSSYDKYRLEQVGIEEDKIKKTIKNTKSENPLFN